MLAGGTTKSNQLGRPIAKVTADFVHHRYNCQADAKQVVPLTDCWVIQTWTRIIQIAGKERKNQQQFLNFQEHTCKLLNHSELQCCKNCEAFLV